MEPVRTKRETPFSIGSARVGHVNAMRGRATSQLRSSRLFRRLVLMATAMAVLLWQQSASALMVWEGEIVHRWPDMPFPARPGSGGPALNGYYPAPQGVVDGYYSAPKDEVWGLTFLVDFSDAAPAFTADEIDDWLNQQGYNRFGLNGSVRDYFYDNSNGMLEFRNSVHGFYRAQRPKSYYEGGSGYQRAGELFAELIDYFDPTVDFSDFDKDNDGRVDAISIVYAGRAETWGQGLWPHASSSWESRDGVRLSRYMMMAMGTRLGLYTFCHEAGHMLFGWPDLYGFGDYCIMGNATSQENPAGVNDFFRADQGWIPQIEVDENTNAVFTATPNGSGYRYLNSADSGECFFWSNIQNMGRWEVLRGSGILVLHFDEKIGRNDPPNPLGLAVVQADGYDQLGVTMWPRPGSDPADFFHQARNAEFSSDTRPASRWNNGTPSGLRIYDVSAISDEMTFSVGTGPLPEPDAGAAGAGAAGTPAAGAGAAGTPADAGIPGDAAAGGNSAEAGMAGAPGAAGAAGASGDGASGHGGAAGIAGNAGAAGMVADASADGMTSETCTAGVSGGAGGGAAAGMSGGAGGETGADAAGLVVPGGGSGAATPAGAGAGGWIGAGTGGPSYPADSVGAAATQRAPAEGSCACGVATGSGGFPALWLTVLALLLATRRRRTTLFVLPVYPCAHRPSTTWASAKQ